MKRKLLSLLLLTVTMLSMFVPVQAADVSESSGINELPKDYVDTSNEDMYQIISADEKNEISLFSLSENAGKKVEIAFVIDTTGSMSSAISNVKSSVTEFAKYLEEQGVNLRMSVVEYRDITCDGEKSTIVHTVNHSPWHTSTAQLVDTLSNLSVDGGGDTPETVIDGLGCLVNESGTEDTTMRWSSDAYKFAFVLTDASYKTDNKWGYENMAQMITALNAKAISTSVITSTSQQSAYKDLIEQTGGKFADIDAANFVSSMKDLADNALSNTVKQQSVDVTVKAISKDSNKEVPVGDATVSVFLEDAIRYYTTDSNGVATIPLNDLTEEQINKATVSAHKAWSIGVVDPLTNNRWYLQSKITNDKGVPERYIYELHSEGIDENGNWYGESLSDIIKGKNAKMIIDEPRLLVNMSVCYYEPAYASGKASDNKNTVKNYMKNLSKSIAQTTDGHIMINKVLIGKTDERTDFYVPAKYEQIYTGTSDIVYTSVADIDSAKLASMADIQIRSYEDESCSIWSNAYVGGYFNNVLREYNIDESILGNFSGLSEDEKKAIEIRNYEFLRMEQGWKDSSDKNIMGIFGETGQLNKSLYVTATHEAGHLIMGFYDEYLTGAKDDKGNNIKWSNSRPKGVPKNFGLMDNQRAEIEMSNANSYAYVLADLNGATAAPSLQTAQYYQHKKSCENFLAEDLLDEYLGAKIEYKLSYTYSTKANPRRAEYSYADIDCNNFIDFDGSVSSEVSVNNINLMSVYNTDALYAMTTKTNEKIGDIQIDVKGNITINSFDGYEDYKLYIYNKSDKKLSKIDLMLDGKQYTGELAISDYGNYCLYLVANKSGNEIMNIINIETTYTTAGCYFKNSSESILGYFIPKNTCKYLIAYQNCELKNNDYFSVNDSVAISTIDGIPNKGELYSVASVNSDIDYTTISWFKYDESGCTKLDTDLSIEENMNIGARCDYVGEGTYVLMAKKASDKELNVVTDIEYTNPTDRDGIVNLTFNDSNTNTAYYNIYYSNSKFTSISDDNVTMEKDYAGKESYTANFGERNKDGYVAVIAVDENGAKSPLSEVVKVNTGEADRDGDGIPDWYCDKYLLWPPSGEEKDIANSDDDSDGLTNLEEYKKGSDPTDPNDPVRTSNVAVQSIELNESNLSIKVGKTSTVIATIKPNDASNKNVQWYTDNESVAIVNAEGLNCTITGVSEGTTKVTAVTVDGGYTASVIVTVSKSSEITGGGGGSSTLANYIVKFETNGGTKIDSVKVEKNKTVSVPTAPTKDRFEFAGWYTNKELTTKYNFSEKVTKNLTLYAAWSEKKLIFTDVKKNDWFAENVKYVFENGLMDGVTNTKFAPNDNLTRAMLVTILYRAEDEPEVNRSIPFVDVMADSYYATAVIWAHQNGIVSGVNENEFAPDENITREQIATIVYRYAKFKGYDTSAKADISAYADSNEISEYAVEAMQYAVGSGLINGKTETTLNPQDNATRAEIAAILQRFIETNK